jgi:hypothetical protein
VPGTLNFAAKCKIWAKFVEVRMEYKKDFRISLPNEPGQLARVCEALGKRDVNIRTLAGISGSKPTLAIITDNEDETRAVLKELGLNFKESDLFTIKLTDIPGEIAFFTRKLTDAKINIESIYMLGELAGEGQIAFTVDNPEKVKEILKL